MRERSIGSSDDSYLASVSDLMVGLIFIFILILMAYGLNYRAAEESAKKTLDELVDERDGLQVERDELALIQEQLLAERELIAQDRDLLQLQTQNLQAIALFYATRNASRRSMLKEIRDELLKRKVDVTIEPNNGILRLPEELLFDSGQAELRASAEPALRILAEVMARILPCYAAETANRLSRVDCSDPKPGLLETILIEGHTDDRPIKTNQFQDNWDLGARRGTSVLQRLIELQQSLDRLANSDGGALLGISSYEARRPVDSSDSDQARGKNRRIDMRFMIATPSDEELQQLVDMMPQADGG